MTEEEEAEIEKMAAVSVLRAVFGSHPGGPTGAAEQLFSAVWAGYSKIMLADPENSNLTEQEIEDHKNMFKWWFMGGYNARRLTE